MGAVPFSPRRTEAAGPAGKPSSAPDPVLMRRSLEAAALLLFAVALFLAMALATYRHHPHDPTVAGANWMGLVGASVAGALVQGFGAVAWLVPVELMLVGLPLLRGRRVPPVGARIAADLVVLIIVAALAQVAFPEGRVFGAMAAGGNVGLLFGELMRGLFSNAGSFLVGTTSIGLILIGRSSFSFIGWCREVAGFARRWGVWLRVAVRRLAEAWAQAWRLRQERKANDRDTTAPNIHEEMSDEAIIAKLEEDDADWIPLETTGPAPLAVSAALRVGSSGEDTAIGSEQSDSDATLPRPTPSSATLGSATPTGGLDDGIAQLLVAAQTGTEADSAVGLIFEPSSPPATDLASAAPPATRERRSRRKKTSDGPRIVDTRPEQEVERTQRDKTTRDGFQLPSTELLEAAPPQIERDDEDRLRDHAKQLQKTLADYGVTACVTDIRPGPTVTTYEVVPAPGTKVSKILGLSDDLALGLSRKVRINPTPEKGCIGFEIPNDQRPRIFLRDLVEHRGFAELAASDPLPMVLGRDPVGKPFYADLTAMTHVIVAGATGAGKSVGLSVMLASLLLSRSPDELRLLMIDPKVVELAPFDGIPHMLLPVVTDMKQAATALKWAVDEMERRYQLFADAGTKNVKTYNAWVDRVVRGELPPPDPERVQALTADGVVVSVREAQQGSDGAFLPGKLPYIVVVVDEFADLMMQQGKEVEAAVARLAQKARAAGIHVILATQRPSVDVITGMIKANFPSRIAYRVAQKVDSRTILDEQGAEMLLGKGDMLVKMNGKSDTLRVQCPFISEEEVNAVTDFLRAQGSPEYHEAILRHDEEQDELPQEELFDSRYDEAVRVVADTQRCSTSWLQRKMSIGYNRAAKIVDMMERQGIVGPANGVKDREVLVSPQ